MIKISEKKHYAVTMGVYDTFEESRQVGLGLMIQGGSGYVWEKDNKFYVIGSIYSSIEDANKVIENIKNSNYDIDILDIKFSAINIKFDDYENKQVKEIEDALKLIDLIIEEVGSLAIRFDKSEINNFAVSSSLSDLRGDVKVSIATMQNILKIPNEAVNLIQLKLIKIDELLDSAIIQTIEKTENYFLKNINSQMYQIKYDLYQGLAK
ncbi:MAG: hypothetical protein E7345_01750 [Clostridiales bacterium]|nr:hypothetical protein [Clostridiales bacterium]